MTYPIPEAALDDRLGWIGTSGSGKTYNAGVGVERLLNSTARVVIIDPLDVWWGLRLTANGAPSKFTLPIFGGQHGDLPLNASAGKLIGETVASMAESCIVSLSGLGTKSDERRFMLAFLEAVYRHASGNPTHFIFDEADLWAPQKAQEPKLQALMEQIVRRGRVRGFIPWLITQRPAVLSKDVLSQVDGLITFKLTSSQDRRAIGEWVKGQADEGQWAVMDAALPTLPRGTGVVWLPSRGLLATADFPSKQTFDSSRTPSRGERIERRDLKPLDLGKLQAKLASIEEEAKANDPKTLKAEIALLKREIAGTKNAGKPAWPDQREEVARLRGIAGTLPAIRRALDRVQRLFPKVEQIVEQLSLEIDGVERAIESVSPAPVVGKMAGDAVPSPVKAVPRVPPRPHAAREVQSDGSIPHGCAKPLAALASVFPAGMTEAQWATAAGYKRSGGTWGTYKSRLKAAAMIEQRDGKFFATQTGAEAVGDVELPPSPGPELVRWWAAKLPGTSRMAEVLIEAWPHHLSKEDLADRLGMAASGGSFGTYLSRLASPGLITRDNGTIRLSEEVMA
ncbi:MAG TPA: hypothetical protein VFJ46_17735 [Xanthobacteraceae bacterium]|nr:hypothetical protein [Xanthobacteraceae bacterium]